MTDTVSRDDYRLIQDDEPMDVHTYFGLTYSNYLILHRTLLQSMPLDWQLRFIGCVRELNDAFDHIDKAPGYDVRPVDWIYTQELTADQMDGLGVTVDYGDEDDSAAETVYHHNDSEIQPLERLPVPVSEPIPHYNRGRTHIEPQASGDFS